MGSWDSWIGKPLVAHDLVAPAAVARFAAMLDAVPPRQLAPQGFHWCLCLPDAPTAEIDVDGHPKRGGFLPPVDLPRRMWVASAIRFLAPLPIGAAIERVSTVAAIGEKQGGSGKLVFVEIDHLIRADGAEAVRERQTVVYREPAADTPAAPSPSDGSDLSGWEWQRGVTPSQVLLFRYSALTFNSHRIHYDLPYATGTEGYPGLIVQGPLMGSLLLDLCTQQLGPQALAAFSFRAHSPAFAGQALTLVGRQDSGGLALAVIGGDGHTIVSAAGSPA